MAKQSVIKDIKVSDFNGKKSYTAVLEDGTTGYFDPKKCGEHEKGEAVEYTVEPYTSKAGKKSNILTLTKVNALIGGIAFFPIANYLDYPESRGLSSGDRLHF